MNTFNNVGAIFGNIYFYYKDVPKETMFEGTIAERSKLRTEKIAEIEKEEENINNYSFKDYFTNYRSPSDIYKKLRETEGTKNENRVYLIKQVVK